MTTSTLSAPYPRNYSLEGPLNRRAQQIGLANAEWYRTAIPRARMKELMQRSDGAATRDTLVWIVALVVTGGLGAYFWGSWLCVLFFLVYGVLYGSAGDSRWHECGHGTAFKTPWKNDVVYQIACFMTVRNPAVWRWSHSRHHTDTIIVGRDPEIITMRPPGVLGLLSRDRSDAMAPAARPQPFRAAQAAADRSTDAAAAKWQCRLTLTWKAQPAPRRVTSHRRAEVTAG